MDRNKLVSLAAVTTMLGCYTGYDGVRKGNHADSLGDASTGSTEPGDTGDSSGDEPPGVEDPEMAPVSGMRRLTAAEYDATLIELLGDESRSSGLILPQDARNPFDNDYTIQLASVGLVEGVALLAADATGRLLDDVPRRDVVVGCTPEGSDDRACMEDFVTRFGRKALRRPLTADETELWTTMALEHAVDVDDFYEGVDTFVRLALQHPEFVYRVEVGTPVDGEPGMFRLNQWEVATRLAFLVWGATPNDWLLDAAEDGQLDTTDGVRDVAAQMLSDETDTRAVDRAERFHSLWLGYETLPHPTELSAAMKAETRALIERVIFEEEQPWEELFRLDETFIDKAMAEHYDLRFDDALGPPDEKQWVSYEDKGRRGLLAHGSFLSVQAVGEDTNPVRRGIMIRTRLFCQDIPPPPKNVDVDEPITGDNICKVEKAAKHREGTCAGCHLFMDPVGFGLEKFDSMGRYREFEYDDPTTLDDDETTCRIEGIGELQGIGTFSGPAELGQLAIDSNLLKPCVITQLYRFSVGRYELDSTDLALVDQLVEELGESDFRFTELLLDFVGSPEFHFRTEEV